MPLRGDDAFPMVAVSGGLPVGVSIVFVLGLISSTYSAAGSALTSLTTSFTLDVMGAAKRTEADLARLRMLVHSVMAIIVSLLIMLFEWLGEGSVINLVFRLAGYTYGPILGMFIFGILCRRKVREKYVPIVAVVAPVLSYLLQYVSSACFAYEIGFELLGYNALFTILGLTIISYNTTRNIISEK